MKEETVSIYRPGTQVFISANPQAPIPASINKVIICSNDHIIYEVIWWDAGVRRVEGVKADEISVRASTKMKVIGFEKVE